MSSPFEKFVQENRDRFDDESPDPRILEKIIETMGKEKIPVKSIHSLSFKRWLATAAAALLVTFAGFLYKSLYPNKPVGRVAVTKPRESVPVQRIPVQIPVVDSSAINHQPSTANRQPSTSIRQPEDDSYNEEMYHYARLVAIKHKELKTLEKDEPLLYKQFSGDVQKLDKVYHSLEIQLPQNSNREQLIEAMISNLQLQIGLLNKQLKIIKQIKHSKKSAYEQAYKSI